MFQHVIKYRVRALCAAMVCVPVALPFTLCAQTSNDKRNKSASRPAELDSASIVGVKEAIRRRLPVYAGVLELFDDTQSRVQVPEEEIWDAAVANMRQCMRDVLQPSVFATGSNADNIPIVGVQKIGQVLRAESRAPGKRVVMIAGLTSLAVGLRIEGEQIITSDAFQTEGVKNLLAALEHILRLPSLSADQFDVHGKAIKIEEVQVYTGQVERNVSEGGPIDWHSSIHVFVTDSIPQYVYIQVGPCAVDPVPEGRRARAPELFKRPLVAADFDRDIVNRPSFKRAVSQKRLQISRALFYFGDTMEREDFVLADVIPESARQAIGDRWAIVIRRAFLPPSEEAVEWREYAPGEREHSPDHGVVGRWFVQGRQIIGSGAPNTEGVGVIMRLLGDERIPLRDRPAELDPDVREWHNWQWLDRSSLHEVLTTVLGVPFTSQEEYAVRGSLEEAGGVRIFKGRIGWLKRSERTGQGQPRWYDELRLSVTDSDPQYVMIGVPHGVDSHKP